MTITASKLDCKAVELSVKQATRKLITQKQFALQTHQQNPNFAWGVLTLLEHLK